MLRIIISILNLGKYGKIDFLPPPLAVGIPIPVFFVNQDFIG